MAALSGTIAAIRRSRRRRASGILNGLALLGTSFLTARSQKQAREAEAAEEQRRREMEEELHQFRRNAEERAQQDQEFQIANEAEADAERERDILRDKAADKRADAHLTLAERREKRLSSPDPNPGGGSAAERILAEKMGTLMEQLKSGKVKFPGFDAKLGAIYKEYRRNGEEDPELAENLAEFLTTEFGADVWRNPDFKLALADYADRRFAVPEKTKAGGGGFRRFIMGISPWAGAMSGSPPKPNEFSPDDPIMQPAEDDPEAILKELGL